VLAFLLLLSRGFTRACSADRPQHAGIALGLVVLPGGGVYSSDDFMTARFLFLLVLVLGTTGRREWVCYLLTSFLFSVHFLRAADPPLDLPPRTLPVTDLSPARCYARGRLPFAFFLLRVLREGGCEVGLSTGVVGVTEKFMIMFFFLSFRPPYFLILGECAVFFFRQTTHHGFHPPSLHLFPFPFFLLGVCC